MKKKHCCAECGGKLGLGISFATIGMVLAGFTFAFAARAARSAMNTSDEALIVKSAGTHFASK